MSNRFSNQNLNNTPFKIAPIVPGFNGLLNGITNRSYNPSIPQESFTSPNQSIYTGESLTGWNKGQPTGESFTGLGTNLPAITTPRIGNTLNIPVAVNNNDYGNIDYVDPPSSFAVNQANKINNSSILPPKTIQAPNIPTELLTANQPNQSTQPIMSGNVNSNEINKVKLMNLIGNIGNSLVNRQRNNFTKTPSGGFLNIPETTGQAIAKGAMVSNGEFSQDSANRDLYKQLYGVDLPQGQVMADTYFNKLNDMQAAIAKAQNDKEKLRIEEEFKNALLGYKQDQATSLNDYREKLYNLKEKQFETDNIPFGQALNDLIATKKISAEEAAAIMSRPGFNPNLSVPVAYLNALTGVNSLTKILNSDSADNIDINPPPIVGGL